MTAHTTPPLTTIQQDRIALGKCGFYALSSLLNHVAIGSILLRAQLILRDSTGPVAPQIGPMNPRALPQEPDKATSQTYPANLPAPALSKPEHHTDQAGQST